MVPISTALNSFAQHVEEAHGIQVECIGDGILKSLPKDMHVLFFRKKNGGIVPSQGLGSESDKYNSLKVELS
jgi:hypothetical protein